ncbi:hypothetical protein G9A89_005025 [Geosiphon pyriformis]|nr:hypothetical protein G9A89_005025 [Geosiphon pyriformis]
MHPVDLPTAVTHARDFKAAELEANHAQAVNLVMNGSSELDSKLKQFIYHGSRKCMSATTVVNKTIFELIAILIATNNREINTEILIATTNLSTASISIFNLLTAASSNLSATAPNNLSVSTINPNTTSKLSYNDIRKPKTQNCSKLKIGDGCSLTGTGPTQNPTFQHYLSLLVTSEDVSTSNQEPTQKQQTLTSNIPSATVTNNESLATIFSFEIEEPSSTLLFSGATLDEKSITAMYTDAKVNDQSIKLILNSGSAGSHQVDRAASARIITADGVTKTLIGKIDNFPFEVNGIVTPIKVLVMEATQYQALVGNDWLFKTPPKEKLLIELEKKKEKLTWEAYQVSWADADHNKLLPILAWDDNNNGKEKQGKEPTCETTIDTGTNDKDHYKLLPVLSWDDNPKGKQKEELIWETNNLT